MNGNLGRYERTAQLFDKNATDTDNGYRSSKYITSTGGENNSSNHIITEYIDISSYTHLTCSNVNTQSSVYNCFYDNNYEKISLFRLDEVPKTVEVPNGAKYIRLSVSKSLIDDYMLNAGSTALPYAPYGLVWNDIPYSKLETATDVVTSLPVKVYGDGETDISLLIKGNTETSGNPSPSTPITIDGVGNKTANLYDANLSTTGYSINANGVIVENANYVVSDYIPVQSGDYTLSLTNEYTGSSNTSNRVLLYDTQKQNAVLILDYSEVRPINVIKTINVGFDGFIRVSHRITDTNIMLNEGAEALPFEPYGKYKISILKGLQLLTPIYLSQQLYKIDTYSDSVISSGTATYNIRKYEFTGNEADLRISSSISATDAIQLPTTLSDYKREPFVCSHMIVTSSSSGSNTHGFYGTYLTLCFAKSMELDTLEKMRTYLQQQYAAGTPVTVYYVLETATTESVTAPTITTTGGEVSIDVDTTVKPSELDLTYHGWHEHEPLKYNNGSWS